MLPLPHPKHIQIQDSKQKLDTLHPRNTLGKYFIRVLEIQKFQLEWNIVIFSGPNPNRLGLQSRQASSNSGEGNNRESSLDDSGVVDDHEPEGDATSEEVASQQPLALRVSKGQYEVSFYIWNCYSFFNDCKHFHFECIIVFVQFMDNKK